jgi:hypothetical protein
MKTSGYEVAQVPGHPRYTFTSDGRVFKDGIEKTVSCKKNRSAKVVIRINHKMYTLGLAKLIAEAFIPNPRNYKRIIFKDRDHHNCRKDNIAWVDEETFFFYCYPTRKHRLIVNTQEFAIANAKDAVMKQYYITLDEYWLEEAWKEVNQRLSEYSFWPKVMSAVYIHFLGRAKRFSIMGRPTGLMWYYARSELIKLKKEISPNLPYKKLMQTDESLRDVNFED